MDYELFITQGKQLGYSGEELQEFVTECVQFKREKRKQDREERNLEREERNAQRELEKLLAQEKLEKIRIEKDLEKLRVEKELENERIKLQHEHDLQMAQIQQQPDKNSTSNLQYKPSRSTLPVFDEVKDNMESFLDRFERWAKGRNIPGAYTRMDAETSLDYNSVKKVLMERFKLTEEGFRQKFRNSRPERGETPSQFIIKISSHLNKWFEMAGVNTLEKAIDLLIREQFVKICPSNLTMYLKERECSDIDKMTHWAEMFVEAHGLHTFKLAKIFPVLTWEIKYPAVNVLVHILKMWKYPVLILEMLVFRKDKNTVLNVTLKVIM